MKKIKSILCFSLIFVLLMFTACSQQTTDTTSKNGTTPSSTSKAASTTTSFSEFDPSSKTGGLPLPLFPSVRKISIMAGGGDNWNKDNTVLQEIAKRTNVEITFTTFPWSSLREKYQTLAATGELADLLMGLHDNYAQLDKLIKNNMLEPISDHLNEMPNFKKALKDFPDAEGLIKGSDGKIYLAFANGFYAPYGVNSALLYSPVWLKEAGVEFKGETWNDVYETAKKLKAYNPDAYPFLTRSGFNALINRMAPQFGTGVGEGNYACYYDAKNNKWKFGASEDGYRQLVAFLNKLYTEKLLHPEAPTMSSQQYLALIMNEEHKYKGGAFLFESSTWHKSGYNAGKPEDPFYPFEVMLPPKGVDGGERKVKTGYEFSITGYYGHVINKKAKDMEAVIKFLDYTYSQDGQMFLTWGIEGVHYNMETVDGQKVPMPVQFKDKPYNKNDIYTTYVNNIMFGYNFGFYGLKTLIPKVNTTYPFVLKDKVDAQEYLLKNNAVMRSDPIIWFNDMESTYILTKSDELNKKIKEVTAQFIMGQKPMSEWNSYVADLEKMGSKQYEKMFNDAWARKK